MSKKFIRLPKPLSPFRLTGPALFAHHCSASVTSGEDRLPGGNGCDSLLIDLPVARIASLPQGQLHELLPWNWSVHVRTVAAHQAA